MKKFINIFSATLFLLTGVGHEVSSQEFYAGANIAGGASHIRYHSQEYRDQFESKLKPSIKGGLSINVPLTNTFILSSELNYAMRGRKVTVEENSWTLNEWHQYIEFPLILNFQRTGEVRQIGPFDRIGPFNWIFGIGPNISYLLGGRGTLETYALATDYQLSFGGEESNFHYITFNPVNRWQWGLDFNLGLVSPLINGSQLITTLKFTYGHTHLGTPEGSSMPILGFTDNIAHNYKILSFSVAYMFKFDLRLLKKGRSASGQPSRTKAIDTSPKKGKNINKIKK